MEAAIGLVRAALAGTVLVAYAAALALLSWAMARNGISRPEALAALAALGVAAGVAYLVSLARSPIDAVPRSGPSLAIVVVAAVAARAVLFAAPPLLETDYQRYLWDGAVVAAGVDPYRYAPGDVLAQAVQGPAAETLASLATDGKSVLAAVNHPHLSTIYPPLAQVAFALASMIAPFDPVGLRVVFLVADLAGAALLVRLLAALGLPPARIALYALNPLFLRETYSALHMDVLLVPPVAAALLLAVGGRSIAAALVAAAASAIKGWPILLVPLLLRPERGRTRRLLLGTTAALGAAFVLWLPVLIAPHGDASGFVAYGRGWQNNDGAFRLGILVAEHALTLVGASPWYSHTILRILVTALLVSLAGYLALRRPEIDPVRGGLVIVGAIFLLSPTQFPWYWSWCLPFVTVRPFVPLLLYTALLPIHYATDALPGGVAVWLQHGPVWAALFVAAWRWRAARRTAHP